tara:strand:+ start:71 stop:256 length:186 start_codon:yes stop_codon:yes gene_type:complete
MLVPKVLLEHKVLRVIKDRMELVDQQVHKVHKEPQVLKVLKVLKDIRGRVELVDPQVLKEQ